MDSLTAHYLARELDSRWRARRVLGIELARAARTVVIAVEGSSAVAFDLSRPAPLVHESDSPPGGLLAGWTVEHVEAPEDDRRIVVVLARPGKFRGSPARHARVEVGFVPTARGAVVREGTRQLAALGARLPRPAKARPVLEDDEVTSAARRGDESALLRGRWTSARVARWLIADPELAASRYRELCALPSPSPARCDDELLPFALCADALPAESVIAPHAPAASAAPGAESADERRTRALHRLREELERSTRAPRVRAIADVLLALGDVAAPASVRFADGTEESVSARPGERARDVAERLFAELRSMERARTRLPARIAALEAGGAMGRPTVRRARAEQRGAAPGEERVVRRPFRTYRSSGGLEIWVGRDAGSNDELTFHAAAPSDVWMHARDASGAHVVLRWSRDEPPPARDLEEAAALAAWHSKARGSAVVPVDWTRRRYVRKPRGGRPGLVVVQRSQTVFARPSAEMERALRAT